MQSAPEPGVPGAIRKRQPVLPRCSARSHPACDPAATSSSSPALSSDRSCSPLFNHSCQILTLGGGGEAGTGLGQRGLCSGQAEPGKKASVPAAQPRHCGGTRKIIWLMQKHPLERDGVTDRKASPPEQGLIAVFVRCEGRDVGVRDFWSRFSLCLARGARWGERKEWARDVLASCHKAFADLSVNISQKRLNARVSSEGAVL